MNVINRAVLIVKPKRTYIDWANSLDGPEFGAVAIKDATTYLVPDVEGGDAEEKIIRRYFKIIFDQELSSWWTNEDDWPQNRDLKTFREWFHAEFHFLVLDLCNTPLVSESW